MPDGRDIMAGAIVSGAFLALVAVAEIWRLLANPPAEWTRKLVHVGGGLVCLILPLVIESHWVVLAMAIGMGVLFTATRGLGWLSSVHGVGRVSHGTLCYPFVIYLLFLLSHDRPWKYFICVLVLAVADGLAALVGSHYGRIRYEVENEWKSLEGSLVFLIVTFVAVQVPLVVWPDPTGLLPTPALCVLAAVLVAALVTGFEAISLHGSDNLWVPIGTYFVLGRVLRLELIDIAMLNVSLLVICLIVGLSAWWTRAFNVGGTLTFILFAFASWSLGSFHWAVPMFIGYAAYLVSRHVGKDDWTLKVLVIFRWLLPPFCVLAVANLSWHYGRTDWYCFWYGPYLAGCVTVLIQSVWDQIRRDHELRLWQRQCGVAVVSFGLWLLMAGPAWWLQTGVPLAALLTVGASCLAAGILHDALMPHRPPEQPTRAWVVAQVSITCTAMLLATVFQAVGWSESWQPW